MTTLWTKLDDEGKPAEPPEASAERDEEEAISAHGRRDFLKTVGFGAAAVTVASCEAPVRFAMPLVAADEQIVAGNAAWFASTCGGCPAACGVLLKTRDGRPIKVEGNPDHPVNGHPVTSGQASRVGALCAVGQAASLSLYDSTRPLEPTLGGRNVSWSQLDSHVSEGIAATRAARREVLLLTGAISSPTTLLAIRRFTERTGASHVVLDPLGPGPVAEAHAIARGRAVVPVEQLDRAELVVSLGADLLGTGHSTAEHTRRWSTAHRPDRRARRMGRWIQLEGRMSLTGAHADERHRVRPSDYGLVLAALLRRTAASSPGFGPLLAGLPQAEPELPASAIDRLARLLSEARGRALVVAEPTDVHTALMVSAINESIGAYGTTLDVESPRRWALGNRVETERALEAMESGRVGALFVWDTNPIHAWPDASRMRRAFERAPTRVAMTDRHTETSALCTAVAPAPHFLEGWNDAEPRRGVVAVQQPGMRPRGHTRATQESLLRWAGEDANWLEWLRRSWAKNVFPRQRATPVFTAFWDSTLERGFAEVSVESWELPDGSEPAYGARTPAASPPADAATGTDSALRPFDVASVAAALSSAAPANASARPRLELSIHPALALRTGHDANNPWLQELADPISKVSWTNHASVSPGTARRLGLRDGDVVALRANGRSVELPVVLQPGQHDAVVSVAAGYGRTVTGPVGNGIGANVFPLLGAAPSAVEARRTGGHVTLPRAQVESGLHDRDLVRSATFAELVADPRAGNPRGERHLSIWPGHRYDGHRWAMAIDLSACTGCSACVVGCQVENNVPVVGPEETARNREMGWIRIDRYYAGDDPDEPQVVHQPMMCQHCENAPCETVCPVIATAHSSEGLNQQIYNRCVGTRYCANNCPYKARRFNWFDYPHEDATARLALNPDVVVRSRGVMEKCSFCVQRIQAGKWAAQANGRPLADGDIQPACAQSCPARAIVFGDLHDPRSEVSQLVHGQRAYRVLAELNVGPSVSYLTRIRNSGQVTVSPNGERVGARNERPAGSEPSEGENR